MARSIDDIMATRDEKGRFGSKKQAEPEQVQAESQPEADATPQPEPEPQAVEEPKASPETPAEPEPQQPAEPDPEADPKNWTYAAYRDEKAKRQEAMRKAQALETELAQHRAFREQMEQQARRQPPPDQFADPEGYNAYWENRLQEREQAFQNQLRDQQANLSLRLAHKEHGEDFEQAYSTMISMAENGDRSIVQAVAQSPDPGETLVRWFNTYRVQQEIGNDPASYRERIRQEVLAEFEKERGTQSETPQQPQSGVQMPSNLAGQRSVGPRTGPAWGGPSPIADIFDRRAKALGKR